MSYKKVLSQLKGELSDDVIADMDHLLESEDVSTLCACINRIYEMTPNKGTDVFLEEMSDALSLENIMEPVRNYISSGENNKALSILEDLINNLPKLRFYNDICNDSYYCYDEFFEQILLLDVYKVPGDIKYCPIPFHDIYWLYGCLMIEDERYNEAQQPLETALKWNPVNMTVRFELIEVYKHTLNLESLKKYVQENFKYAFKSSQVARCYRDYGYYLIEIGEYVPAFICYKSSNVYDDTKSEHVLDEMEFILDQSEEVAELIRKDEDFSEQEIDFYGEKFGFPVGANPDIIDIALNYCERFINEDKERYALYFAEIIYDLTGDEEIKEEIDEMAERVESET